MTQRVKVKITGVELGAQTAKAEEVLLLMAIAEQFDGKDMYLSSLFSKQLLEWFSSRVRDDFSTDIIEELESYRKTNADLNRLMREDEANAMKEVSKMEQRVKSQDEMIRDLEESYRNKSQYCESLENDCVVYRKDVTDLLEREADALKRCAALEERIVELKAQLYDFMMKEKEGRENGR